VIVDRAPGHMQWWVMARDEEARAWVEEHPGDCQSGCWVAHADQLDPMNATRLF
jgi:hypothetical protein